MKLSFAMSSLIDYWFPPVTRMRSALRTDDDLARSRFDGLGRSCVSYSIGPSNRMPCIVKIPSIVLDCTQVQRSSKVTEFPVIYSEFLRVTTAAKNSHGRARCRPPYSRHIATAAGFRSEVS